MTAYMATADGLKYRQAQEAAAAAVDDWLLALRAGLVAELDTLAERSAAAAGQVNRMLSLPARDSLLLEEQGVRIMLGEPFSRAAEQIQRIDVVLRGATLRVEDLQREIPRLARSLQRRAASFDPNALNDLIEAGVAIATNTQLVVEAWRRRPVAPEAASPDGSAFGAASQMLAVAVWRARPRRRR